MRLIAVASWSFGALSLVATQNATSTGTSTATSSAATTATFATAGVTATTTAGLPVISNIPGLNASVGLLPDQVAAHQADCFALQTLYQPLGGSGWFNNTGWTSTDMMSCCTWFGVGCDRLGAVLRLVLPNNNLVGSIPPTISAVTRLLKLDLSNNTITGTLPNGLGALGNLQSLVMRNNQFTGIIPTSLGKLRGLQWLDLSYNQFTGNIPPELTNLAKLERLFLSHNQLYGSVPDSFSTLQNLQWFHINFNQLAGAFPSFNAPPRLGYCLVGRNVFQSCPYNWNDPNSLAFQCGLSCSAPSTSASAYAVAAGSTHVPLGGSYAKYISALIVVVAIAVVRL
ncbi:hypothetical protein BZG36_05152 [Bifiguratus adelaidae]|uniref:Leucine-rich repeat-containing N-terminal plant-type domain-containing protein n=1 Tax=Bifiguratus adelaidae TaxID=1938954 RepID=A0A261XU33_9FUNG|nr:hypothetical protein BZG36_05152 [Bifiguratus adelaidae]